MDLQIFFEGFPFFSLFHFCFLFALLTSPFSSRVFFFPLIYLSFSILPLPFPPLFFLHSPLFSSFLALMYFIHLPFCPPFVQCKKVCPVSCSDPLFVCPFLLLYFLKQSWRGISLDGRNRVCFTKICVVNSNKSCENC